MIGYVDSRTRQTDLVLVGNQPETYFWVNDLDWIDDKNLFVQFDMRVMYEVDQKTDRGFDINRLALFDGSSRRIRPIYESPSLLAATASKKYLAVVEGDADKSSQDLVISEWQRDGAGRIISSKYVPPDTPKDIESGEWSRFLDYPSPPLKSIRSG